MELNELNLIIQECRKSPEKIIEKITNGKLELAHWEENFILAKCKGLMGNYSEAEIIYNNILSNVEEGSYLIAEVYIDLGVLRHRESKMEEAKQCYFKGLEYSSINYQKNQINRAYINLGAILITEGLHEEALALYSKVDLHYLKVSKDKMLLSVVLTNLAISNYFLHNNEKAHYYKKMFFELYEEGDKKTLNFNKYLLLQAKNDAEGEYYKAIKYIYKLQKYGKYKRKEYAYLDYNKTIAILYKKLGCEEKALSIMLDNLKLALEQGYSNLILEMMEELLAWGCEEKIPRRLCMDILLMDINRHKEDNKKVISVEIKNLEEKVRIKRNAIRAEKHNKSLSTIITKLYNETKIDPLTKLFNRRYLEELNNNFLALSKKYYTLAILDLDNFKNINDNYGHMSGDRLLVEVGALLKYTSGYCGKAFRYGGDEFFLIYEHKDKNEGYELLKNICNKVKKFKINEKLDYNKVAFSIGAITIETEIEKGKPLNEFIDQCDKLLYRSKDIGKDEISISYIIKE